MDCREWTGVGEAAVISILPLRDSPEREARRKRPAQKNMKPVGFSGFQDQSDMDMLILAYPIVWEKVINIKEIVTLNSVFSRNLHSPHLAETVSGKPCRSPNFIEAS